MVFWATLMSVLPLQYPVLQKSKSDNPMIMNKIVFMV